MNTPSSPTVLAPLHPGIVTARFFETWDFYTTHLGFKTVRENNRYVQLAHPSGAQLGVLREETDGQPSELISATDGRGFWLKLDLSDIDAAHAELLRSGVTIVTAPEEKPWGERCLTLRDPNGILILLAESCATPRGSEPAACEICA